MRPRRDICGIFEVPKLNSVDSDSILAAFPVDKNVVCLDVWNKT
jgi:hypothetical protein